MTRPGVLVLAAAAAALAVGVVVVAGGGDREQARQPVPDRAAVEIEPARPAAVEVLPLAVRIPRLGVDSPLDRLSTDAAGALVPPDTADRAGWFAAGTVPGERGPAVIAGHVDSRESGPGVFFALAELRPGDDVEVERTDGVRTFRVLSVDIIGKDEFPTDRVYGPTPVPELRIITCGGGFDREQRRYLDNVIVRAELINDSW